MSWNNGTRYMSYYVLMNNWAFIIFFKGRFTKLILPYQNCPSCAIIDKLEDDVIQILNTLLTV